MPVNRVLVIEDDPLLRDALVDILSFQQFSTIAAADGVTGLHLAEVTEPDAILCDIDLPELGGFDVLEQLQTKQATAGIPFIFLTGQQSAQVRRRGMRLGADDFLTKPFDVDDLCDALRTRIQRHQSIVASHHPDKDSQDYPQPPGCSELQSVPEWQPISDLRSVNEKTALLVEDLPLALARSQLSVVYQPQFDVCTHQMLGAEALIRWSHPQLGQIPPSVFMAMAEESDLIVEIGQWVLEESLRRFGGNLWGPPGFRLAINVSTRQLQAHDFAENLFSLCDSYDFPPHCLEVEITETLLLQPNFQVCRQLNRLKKKGVQIALDDFGTGFASLQQLQQIPCDTLKIDACFVKELRANHPSAAIKSAAIVRSIIRLARMLELTVVAEGIETAEQLTMLRRYGCDIAQGFLLGRPMTYRQLLRYSGYRLPH